MTRAIMAALAIAASGLVAPQPDAPGAIELPAPTGPYPVATTTWRLTDTTRKETFTTAGDSRQVEVIAWYPAAAPRRTGALAPYLREGLPEVRTFATVFRAARSAFDALEQVRTHAELDGAPRVTPRKLPVLVFSAAPGRVRSFHGRVMAGQFCLDDRRCRAGLNLDGIPQSGTVIDGAIQRPFLMVYSARPGRLGANDPIYRTAARPYYRADVKHTRHLDFTDMVFWGGPLRERPVLGTLAPNRITEITRVIVRRYFDQELLGQRAALSGALAPLAEVTFRTVTPAATR